MPRNVRNFWVKAQVDGRPSVVEFGPRSKDGGMTLSLLMRSDGGIVTAAEIWCRALDDGRLLIDIEPRDVQLAYMEEQTGAAPVGFSKGEAFVRAMGRR